MKKKKRVNEIGTYTPGAEGRGRSVGIEPPWKSLRVIVLPPNAFFFDIIFFASLVLLIALSTLCFVSICVLVEMI